MIAHIIGQIVILLIALGGLTQLIIFKMQKKKGWWLGLVIVVAMIAATLALWLGN